jgi:hypothetical protein
LAAATPLLPEAAPPFSPPCVPPASLLCIVRSADRDIWYQSFHPGTFPEPSSSQIEPTRPRRYKRPSRTTTTSTATSNATTTPHPTTNFTSSSPGYYPGSIEVGEEDPPSNPNLRMATVEEKLEKLAEYVLKIGVEQVKGFSKLDHLNSWSITAEKTATELRESISDLTSRMTALEAMFTKAPLKVPPREEEGRANRHGVHISQQGQESKGEDPGFHPAQGYVAIP